MSLSESITLAGVVFTFLGVLLSLFVNKKQFEKQLQENEQTQEKMNELSKQLFEKQLQENKQIQEKTNELSKQFFEKERLNEQLFYLRENFEKIENNVVKLVSLLTRSKKDCLSSNLLELQELYYKLKISPFVMSSAVGNGEDFFMNFYSSFLSTSEFNRFIQTRSECFQLLDFVIALAEDPTQKIIKWQDGTLMQTTIDRFNIDGQIFTSFKSLLERISFLEYKLLKDVGCMVK